MASVFKSNTNGSGPIAVAAATPAGATYRLMSVTCHFSAAPTTSEDFTITLDALAGAEYDTLLYSVDPSVTSATDIIWFPDGWELMTTGGDVIDAAFANTDLVTYGVQVTLKAVY